MSEDILARAGEAARALLSTMLGDDAPLRFSTLQPTGSADVETEVQSQLGIYPSDGTFAVLLDPTWLPLIAGLKLGVETQVGDEDYPEIVKELAGLFQSAISSHLSQEGEARASADLQIKAPGEPLDQAV
jgi:hypothetical protein